MRVDRKIVLGLNLNLKMKKLLKCVSKENRCNKNVNFISKKYASKYLTAFLLETYLEQVRFITKKESNIYQDLLTSLVYRFSVKMQDRQQQELKQTKRFCNARKLKVCSLSGRARGFIARFRLARTTFRKIMNSGRILGERKSSF